MVTTSGSVVLEVNAAGGTATDFAGNAVLASGLTASVAFGSLAGSLPSEGVASFVFLCRSADNAAPTVTAITLHNSKTDPTNASPVRFNVTFSEPVQVGSTLFVG